MKNLCKLFMIAILFCPTTVFAQLQTGTIHDIQFGDKTLWACGDNGLILKSADWGKTWKKLNSKSRANLQAIISDGNRVWFIGGNAECGLESPAGNGAIINTSDRGETFQKIPARKLGWLYGGALSNSRAVLVGQSWGNSPSGIFFSSSSGNKWSAVKQSGTGFHVASAFKKTTLGFTVGKGLRIQTIEDLACKKSVSYDARYNQKSVLRDVAALSETEAIAVGDNGLIIKKSKKDWPRKNSGAPGKCIELFDFEAVDALGDFVVVAGGLNKKLFISSDAGENFIMRNSPANSQIRTVKILPDHSILIGCDSGQIWRLDQSEKDWKLVTKNLAKKNIDVMFIIAADDITTYPAIAKHAHTISEANKAGLSVAVVYASCRKYKNIPKDQTLRAAALNAGASAVIVLRDFFGNPARLTQKQILNLWSKHTDIKGDKLILKQLTAAIRLYKPKVVVTACDICTETGVAAENALIAELAQKAVQLAADPTEQKKLELAGLTSHSTMRVFTGIFENTQQHLPWKSPAKKITKESGDVFINSKLFPSSAISNIEMIAATSAWMLGNRSLLERPCNKTAFDANSTINKKLSLFTSGLAGYKSTTFATRIVSPYQTDLASCMHIKNALIRKNLNKALDKIIPMFDQEIKTDSFNPHILLADRAMLIWWQLCEQGKIVLANDLCYKLASKLGRDHPQYNTLLVHMTSLFCSVEYVINTRNLFAHKELTKKEILQLARNFVMRPLWSSTGAGYLLQSQLMLFIKGEKAASNIRKRLAVSNFEKIWKVYSQFDLSADPAKSSIEGKAKVRVYNQDARPVIDGRLTESFWDDANWFQLKPPATPMNLPSPNSSQAPIVKIVRTGSLLVFAFRVPNNRRQHWYFDVAIDSDRDCWCHYKVSFDTKGNKKVQIATRVGPNLKLPNHVCSVKKNSSNNFSTFELAIPIAGLGSTQRDLLMGLQIRVKSESKTNSSSFVYQTYPAIRKEHLPEYFGLIGLFNKSRDEYRK